MDFLYSIFIFQSNNIAQNSSDLSRFSLDLDFILSLGMLLTSSSYLENVISSSFRNPSRKSPIPISFEINSFLSLSLSRKKARRKWPFSSSLHFYLTQEQKISKESKRKENNVHNIHVTTVLHSLISQQRFGCQITRN